MHGVTTTAANVADMTETVNLLPGEESVVFADAGYTGDAQREELQGLAVTWHIATKRRQTKPYPRGHTRLCCNGSQIS